MYNMEEELARLSDEITEMLHDGEPWSESKAKSMQQITSKADNLLQSDIRRYEVAKMKYSSLG